MSRATRLAVLLALLLVPAGARGQASYEQLQTFSSLLNQIRTSYVDSVTYAELIHAAIDGVLESLDPHSRFERRSDAQREMAYRAGALAGTGIAFEEVDGRITVISVYPGSPAERKSISPGDRLVTINDTAVAGLSAADVGLRLLGAKGSKVRLLLERGSRFEPESVQVTIKYDLLAPHSIWGSGMLDQTTGYVRLAEFFVKAGDEMEKAVKDLRGKGARRLILDLRDNPGGAVVGASDIAGLFLPRGTLVFRTVGRSRTINETVSTERDGPFREMPLMVLVNEGSASAAEALVGSLQDHDRALVLGRRTFGKALVMVPLEVPPQGDLVWLVMGRVVTPSGRIIQRAYHGLKAAQYYRFAGTPGAAQDTTALFHTDAGRPVRGGGGIAPDVSLPRPASLPAWFSIVADSGWIEAVADSAAPLLPREPGAAQTLATLVPGLAAPLMQRVHARLQVAAEPDPALALRLTRILGYRAAEVRWGPAVAEELARRSDPDLASAMGYWDKLAALLGK